MKRRTFIDFLGKGIVSYGLVAPYAALGREWAKEEGYTLPFINPSLRDDLVLAEGLRYDVLIKWGDVISSTDRYGSHNDFLAFVPFDKTNPNDGILWVNHEYFNPLFSSGYTGESEKTKEQADKERYEVGGSLVHVRKNDQGRWELVQDDKYNKRLNGNTMIPFNWTERIAGAMQGEGTLANCAGGVTPWGTVLTCEENYDIFYGETSYTAAGTEHRKSDYGWEKFYPNPPEHYGWVVEIDPLTGKAQKHVALGRCAHECATMVALPDGRVVVYTGDDTKNEHLYKFISSVPRSLREGTLYVANLEQGRWLPVDWKTQPALQEKFAGQTETLVRLREAGKALGATPLDRPEDIEIDPLTGNVLVSLTNNTSKGNYHGSLLKITEEGNNYESLRFSHDVFLAGGEETGFSCPDNMAFDKAGNLWFTSDIAGSEIGKGHYKPFGNNGLFVVPRRGKQSGKVLQMASAPKDAEFTGPMFSPDGNTLFLCVQHPGEQTTDLTKPTSTWPERKDLPKSAVVTIEGPVLARLLSIT